MAVAPMQKFVIVSHRCEAGELLEALQQQGICQILNAEEAMAGGDWPELAGEPEKPKDLEELVRQLARSIDFLKRYCRTSAGIAAVLSPRAVIDSQTYKNVTTDSSLLDAAAQIEQVESSIEQLSTQIDELSARLEELRPWSSLDTPVEELGQLEKAVCITGFIGSQHLAKLKEQLEESGAAVEKIDAAKNKDACLIVCLNETADEVRKLLRSAEFENFSFAGMAGTVAEAIKQTEDKLHQTQEQLREQQANAKRLSEKLLKLQILHDHYSNLLKRQQTQADCPATTSTVVLVGWVKKKDYALLEKAMSAFKASSLHKTKPAEGEDIPVEIENARTVQPFEVVTRLYGMPHRLSIDPTMFLAPFFALFFGLCLTDAGYGLLMTGIFLWMLRKIQGDKKFAWMMLSCSVLTVVAGALTGGWFGDAVQQFVPALQPLRQKMMWFDPLEKPMMFFMLSLGLGYIQILTGLVIAFGHNLRQRNFAAAVFDQLTWLVLLNCVVVLIFVGGQVGRVLGYVALIPAAMILLFSQREGGIVARLGMGLYNLFSAIFYMGDVLSYLRLMALGMVTAGMAMATNVIAKIAMDIPYGIGIVLAVLILVGGHLFNMAFSALSAFVHTLRLQYAEFFPKFFEGGGRAFEPLSKKYSHILIDNAASSET